MISLLVLRQEGRSTCKYCIRISAMIRFSLHLLPRWQGRQDVEYGLVGESNHTDVSPHLTGSGVDEVRSR